MASIGAIIKVIGAVGAAIMALSDLGEKTDKAKEEINNLKKKDK